jgi:hypothetical protein
MASLLTLFRKNVETVIEDNRKAGDELVRRLKALTPNEFLRLGTDVWSQLSMSQYRDVVKTIAPEIHWPAVDEETVEPVAMLEMVRWWWRTQAVLTQSILVTMLMTGVVVPTMITAWPTIVWTMAPYTLVRNADPEFWPPCGRLDGNTDGCVYIPTQDLNWDWIAYHAAIPAKALLQINHHLRADYAPRGSMVMVWRSRGKLQEARK